MFQDRVLRGGSWHSPAVYCRSANRGTYSPQSRNISLGFRLVRASGN
jgi:formylglycine-generating enzyme required for sulfatase activity